MSDLSSVLHHIAKHRDELVLRYGVHILDALLHVEQTAVQCVESNGRTVEPKQEYQVLQQLPGELKGEGDHHQHVSHICKKKKSGKML